MRRIYRAITTIKKRKCIIMKTAAEYLKKKLPIIPCGNFVKNKKTNKYEYKSKVPRIKEWETKNFKIRTLI